MTLQRRLAALENSRCDNTIGFMIDGGVVLVDGKQVTRSEFEQTHPSGELIVFEIVRGDNEQPNQTT